MFAAAKTILQDEMQAEDAVQEAFIRVMKNLDKINEENSLQTKNFLVVITKNVALTMARRSQKRRKNIFKDTPSESQSCKNSLLPEVQAEEGARTQYLMSVISRLKPEHQELLTMTYFEGLKIIEAAKILDVSDATARKRLQRARNELRKYLKEDGISSFYDL